MSREERLIRAQEEERLRQELQEAREAFERAHLESKSAMQAANALDANTPDGLYAFRRANSRYRAALERYHIALRNFSDFLLKR